MVNMLVVLWAFCLCLASVHATVYNFSPASSGWQSTIASGLKAGDVVNLSPGTYVLPSRFGVKWQGTLTAPIIIQTNSNSSTPAVFYQTSQQNCIDIADSSNFKVYNVKFTVAPTCGGCKGVRLGSVYNAIFDSIIISDTTTTAFSANDEGSKCYNITLENSIMENTQDTGECVYVGCNDDKCEFHDSVINRNYCYNTTVAKGGSYGSAFQIKTGAYNVLVSNNVCYQLRGVCVLLYDSYNRGPNIADGNLAIDAGDHAIQVSAGAIIRNNIIVSAKLSGIAVVQNQLKSGSPCRDVTIEYNTVTGAKEACMRHNDASATNIIVANNAFFCGSILAGSGASKPTYVKNYYVGSSSVSGGFTALTSITNELVDPAGRNFYPKSTSALIANASTTYQVNYDFNGFKRSTTAPTVGAYEYTTPTNPGVVPTTNGVKQFSPGAVTTTNGASSSTSASTTANDSSATGVVVSFGVFIFTLFALIL